jgi:hypothetical protein
MASPKRKNGSSFSISKSYAKPDIMLVLLCGMRKALCGMSGDAESDDAVGMETGFIPCTDLLRLVGQSRHQALSL